MVTKAKATKLRMATLLLCFGAGAAGDALAQAKPREAVVPPCVTAAKWSADPIPGEDLWGSGGPGGVFVAVKTNGGHRALLSVSALQTLVIESSQLFDEDDKSVSVKEYLRVPAGSGIDLDTGETVTDQTADLRWNTAGGKSLEAVNDAMVYLCRASDRTIAPR